MDSHKKAIQRCRTVQSASVELRHAAENRAIKKYTTHVGRAPPCVSRGLIFYCHGLLDGKMLRRQNVLNAARR